MDNGSFETSPAVYTRFVGIYSGRYGTENQFDAHLGRVWHRRLIDEIIDRPKTGAFQVRSPDHA